MRFSVVIPTFQRRDVVAASVRALASIRFDGAFEVIVVVDGSTDGTTAVLREVALPSPYRLIEQPNAGAASARNRGAAAARGEILLFLDDDMEAAPSILTEHDRSHRQGADAVLGHIPVHPESPSGLLIQGLANSVERRRERLSRPGAPITLFDLLTGQLSVRRELFERLGGFDDAFTRDGTFGNEDLDFGYRLLRDGYRVVFNPAAVSHQRYVVTLSAHFLQWSQAGRADVEFARKHPEQADALFALHQQGERVTRRFIRPLATLPVGGWVAARLGIWMVRVFAALRPNSPRVLHLFGRVRGLVYWRAVHAAGGIPALHPVRVLTYHAVADLAHDKVLRPYGVPPARLRRQLAFLRRLGFHFISYGELRRLVRDGVGVPSRPVLLTFDDAYVDLLEEALPILRTLRAPAITFAVTACVGGTNLWDEVIGAAPLRLASQEALRVLAAEGIAVGAHSRTHARLIRLPPDTLHVEIEGAMQDVERMGLPKPDAFAYPYGEHTPEVRNAAAGAAVGLAFSLDRGRARYGSNPYCVPRTEILRSDTTLRFLWKVLRMR